MNPGTFRTSWRSATTSSKTSRACTSCLTSTRTGSSTSRSTKSCSGVSATGYPVSSWFSLSFCSTGLPLARTRWVRSTFSSHCPHYSNQTQWLTSATLKIFPLKKFGNARNRTRGCWVRSKNATSELCNPPLQSSQLFAFSGSCFSDNCHGAKISAVQQDKFNVGYFFLKTQKIFVHSLKAFN